MHLRGWLAIGLVFVAAGLALAKERTWTSSDGRTMQGEFVRELDGDVTFLIKGKLVTIATDRLSQRDQQIVRDLAAGKEVPDDPAPARPAEFKPSESKPAEVDPFAAVPDRPEEPATAPSSNKKKQKGTESRVWTDIFGRKATGKFIRIFGSSVVVSRAGGPLTIDFFQLSEADQAYVRELLTSRGEEDLIPIKPPPKPAEGTEPDGSVARGRSGAIGEQEPDSNPGPGASPPGLGPFGPGAGPPGTGLGPSGRGPGFGGPRLGPSGSGMGPAGSGLRGPRFPPGLGQPIGGSSAADTTTSSPPHSPPAGSPSSPFGAAGSSPFSPPASDFSSPTRNFAEEQAERARRDAERMQQQLDQAAASTANMFQRVPVCSNCRKQVTEEQAKGSSCPHCGARWAFNHYDPSRKISTSGSPLSKLTGGASERAVRSVLIIVGAIITVIVLCGGAIAVAMAIASASRPKQSYRI